VCRSGFEQRNFKVCPKNDAWRDWGQDRLSRPRRIGAKRNGDDRATGPQSWLRRVFIPKANGKLRPRDLNRPADALATYDKALALKPDYVDALCNRGNALVDLKRPADALASYDKALALKPDYAQVYWNQSLCLLLMGHFEQGWRQYEWR
jgi:tetratricopeptide (TPR) repeat protein